MPITDGVVSVAPRGVGDTQHVTGPAASACHDDDDDVDDVVVYKKHDWHDTL